MQSADMELAERASSSDDGWTFGVVDVAGDGFVQVVEEVRAGQHPGFERLVFEFDEGMPGYHIEYVDEPVRRCGSGMPVRPAGEGVLQIRLDPAAMHTDAAEPTVEDRDRVFDWENFQQLTSTCDFEARATWVLGVDAPNAYRVLELQNPPRLVIDVEK